MHHRKIIPIKILLLGHVVAILLKLKFLSIFIVNTCYAIICTLQA